MHNIILKIFQKNWRSIWISQDRSFWKFSKIFFSKNFQFCFDFGICLDIENLNFCNCTVWTNDKFFLKGSWSLHLPYYTTNSYSIILHKTDRRMRSMDLRLEPCVLYQIQFIQKRLGRYFISTKFVNLDMSDCLKYS